MPDYCNIWWGFFKGRVFDLNSRSQFVPVLSTNAGLCLTAANWQEVGVKTAAYSLDALLLKPGLELLLQITDLKAYLGWSGSLVLNAKDFVLNKKGVYSFTSPFDGSKVLLTPQALIELVSHLKPDAVILPPQLLHDYPELWTHWESSVFPYVFVEELKTQTLQRPHGVYFTTPCIEAIKPWSSIKRYVSSAIELESIQALADAGVDYIESNQPANWAMEGFVYEGLGLLDLKETRCEMQFEIIDPDCSCPTCSQQLTKAYLHHLLLNTPLLCQRFLIQHNVAVAVHEKSSF